MSVYRAEDRETREAVRLAEFPVRSEDQKAVSAKLEKLVAAGRRVSSAAGLIEAVGSDGSQYWAASPWVEGTSLADLVLHHGRFPSEAVLEIARAMLAQLAALEEAGLVHSDIRMENVLVAADGSIRIPHAGLRGVIRPQEGISQIELAPDACSTLAPERVSDAQAPTVSSDLFACGCVWWHILCGRPPLGSGDTLARLRAAQAATIDDLHQWAVDVPDLLARSIRDCLQKDPRERPKSMAGLAERLGSSARQGRQVIARCLSAAAAPRAPWLRSRRARGKKLSHPHRLTVAALAMLCAAAVAWPLWVAHNRPEGAGSREQRAGSREQRAGSREQGARSREQRAGSREPGDGRREQRGGVSRPMVDTAVTPAAFSDAIGSPRSGENLANDIRIDRDSREELRLPTDRPIRSETLQFRAGQRVAARSGRARIVVPREGMTVKAERVCFENIDFVAEESVDRRPVGDDAPAALVRLLAAESEFTGCSFQSANGSPALCTAILWSYASIQRPADMTLPSGRIRMKNCVFRRVAAGLESRVHGAIGLEITSSLHLGPGPMIRLTHAPTADEPLHLHLAQVTLREADALLDCRCDDLRDRAGEINVEASGCIFVPRAQAAIVTLTSDVSPQPLLHELKWTGQGSVVAGQAAFARWYHGDGGKQTMDDTTISIAGLVRGEVEFAGRFDGEPVNSQVVNCQAPLQDTESAGASTRALPPEVDSR